MRVSTGRAAVAAFVVGAPLLFLSEAEALRVIAAVILLVGVALATFTIATPEFLSADQVDDATGED